MEENKSTLESPAYPNNNDLLSESVESGNSQG